MFADGWQYLAGDPFAEPACGWLAAVEDHVVEAVLVDNGDFLRAAKGVDSNDTLLLVVQSGGNVTGIADAAGGAHVGERPAWCAVVGGDDTHRRALEVKVH